MSKNEDIAPQQDPDANNQTSGQQPQRSTKMRKIIMFSILAVLFIAAAIYGWNWYQFATTHEYTDNAQIAGHISPVIPRVEGFVQRIYVDDNQHVSKGQRLLTIDKENFELGIQQAKASLASAKASYQDAKTSVETAKVEEARTEVALEQATTEKERQQRLINDKSTTQQKFDNATYAYKAAGAEYNVARQKVKAAKVRMQKAEANIEVAQSMLQNAELQLSYTELDAPIEGRVSQKNIEPGQFIRPGQPVMAIVNDENIWVVANFKEGQISQIEAGQPVDIEVDAYSGVVFKGMVQSLGGATGSKFALLPPDNASGNFVKVEQRIPVKIIFTGEQPSKNRLKPGMNVIPTVKVKD